MIKRFIVRWGVSALGLWLASKLLGNESISYGGQILAVIVSGFVLGLINTLIKPIVVFFTLPAVLFTLGIFMVVINALMVLLAARLYGPLEVSGFGIAIIAGMIIGVVNWLVSIILEEEK